ncbi:MAG: hypothetical protein K5644_03805, partial [Lachnospiraceae bacterium]|nr:hypothetical protein [Lachnospiraceae bacterium]
TAIGLNDEYMRYIQSFGAILTGEQLVRWNQLKTSIESKAPDGTHSFSVQLSPEQAEHFASGQLLILRDTSGSHVLGDGVAVVSVSHASLDENGLLTAQYDNSMLYVENRNGDLLGPLSFTQTSNGLYNVVRSTYIPLEDYGLNNYKSVLFYLDANDKSEHPDVIRTRVWDEATQTYSSRLGISEDPYRMIQFFNSNRSYPEEIDGVLPEYNAWNNSGLITGSNLLLPNAWGFARLKDQTTYSQLYAMFQITDVQQNVCCTLPVSIKNANFIDFSSASDIETLGCTISLSGCVNVSASPSVHLILSIKNNDNYDGLFSIQDVKINDHRQLSDKMFSRSIAKDQGIIEEWDISLEYLAQIDEIKTISFQFERETGDNHKDAEYVHFVIDNCDLHNNSLNESMGRGMENGISLDVLNIQPSTTGGFDITMLIQNNSDANIYPHSLILNDIQLSSSSLDVIYPGSSRILVSNWENALLLDETELSIHDDNSSLSFIPISQHILSQHGYSEVHEMTLVFTDTDNYYRGNWQKVTAILNEPWEIEETEDAKINSYFTVIRILTPPEANQVTSLMPISESDRYTISFRRLIVGKEQVVVVLEITNRTNDFINILAEETYINNDICSSYPFRFSNEVWIAPNSTTIKPMVINKYDGVISGLEIACITLNMHDHDEMIESSGIITPQISVKTGGDELIWLDAEQVEIEPIRLAPVDTREPVALLDDILMMGNAIDCLQWIEAPLSDDELLNVSDVQMYLVIPDDTSLAVISKQSATKNEQGKYGVLSPGLIACSATDKDELLTTIIKNTNKESLNASVFSRFIIQNDDYMNVKFMVIRSIQFSVDYNNNTAMITDKEVDGDVFKRQSEMFTLTWAKYTVYSETDNEGKLVPFQDMKVETNLITGWEEIINEQPFQIMLRPIMPEDNIMVLFSITNKDGTGYSYMQSYPNPV